MKRTIKLVGRRKAGTYGRTAKKYQKRIANKAVRQYACWMKTCLTLEQQDNHPPTLGGYLV